MAPRSPQARFRATGSSSARDGLYVAVNYNYLRGFLYENDGLNLTLEAVRQLRGTSCNQLDGPRTALVAAGRTGVILQRWSP